MLITKEHLRKKNFAPEEFLDSETAKKFGISNQPNQGQLLCGIKLSEKMQELRDAIKKPITITSGFRSYELNDIVGGSKKSYHTQFLACDFNIEGLEPHEAVLAIKQSGISVDKCFVERGCVHVQFQLLDTKNQNLFGSAIKVNGEWKVLNQIKKII